YLVLAPALVALLAITRGRRRVIAAMLAVLVVLSFADGWLTVQHGIDRAYYGTDTRALEFLVGALLAVVVAGRVARRRVSRVVAACGVPALAAMVWATTTARSTDAALF